VRLSNPVIQGQACCGKLLAEFVVPDVFAIPASFTDVVGDRLSGLAEKLRGCNGIAMWRRLGGSVAPRRGAGMMPLRPSLTNIRSSRITSVPVGLCVLTERTQLFFRWPPSVSWSKGGGWCVCKKTMSERPPADHLIC
jgi:hypothetical protein